MILLLLLESARLHLELLKIMNSIGMQFGTVGSGRHERLRRGWLREGVMLEILELQVKWDVEVEHGGLSEMNIALVIGGGWMGRVVVLVLLGIVATIH